MNPERPVGGSKFTWGGRGIVGGVRGVAKNATQSGGRHKSRPARLPRCSPAKPPSDVPLNPAFTVAKGAARLAVAFPAVQPI